MRICINYKNEDPYFRNQLQALKNEYQNISIIFNEKNENLNLHNIDMLVTSHITDEEISTANDLKAMIVPYTGINNLPLNKLKEKNIKIVNSHAHAPIVALRAFSLGLALLGRVVELHQELRYGNWVGLDGTSRWTSIINMRCGMIGMGEIGQNIVNFLKPFNNKIVTLERYKPRCQHIENITYYDSIKEIISNSDIIFISLPLTEETKHLIDKEVLSNMSNKYLVNVGRGEIIKEDDLYHALKSKTLKACALDVWYQYPKKKDESVYPGNFPFHELNNIVLSPHCSGNTSSSNQLVIDEIIENLKLYISENKLKNVVNVEKKY